MCNSWAERLGVSGEMSGGLVLKRFLKVLQIDAFDAGEAVEVAVMGAPRKKKSERDGVLPKGLWGLGLRRGRGRMVIKTGSKAGPEEVPERSGRVRRC